MRPTGAGVVGVLAAGAAMVGCILVTGGTSGYQGVDAGVPSVDAGVCLADDGGVCVVPGCAIEPCSNGEVCCAGLIGTRTIGAACQTGPCGLGYLPLCMTSKDCAGADCINQDCAVAGNTITLQICGVFPGCLAVAPGPDAGPSDASFAGGG